MSTIEIKNLTKRYGEAEVLSNINMKLESGKIYGLVGRNGSGKTMLMKHILGLVGLDPESKKAVGKYSLGMRQRLGLAQALMENPDILLLDEPLSGLDNDGVQEMWKLFLKQKEDGKLIVLASHSKEDIGTLCDEIFRFDKGKMVGHEIKRE